MSIAAIYARYSTQNQRETSIDDQVRRCREIAARHGLNVPDELVFSDAAVSGSDESVAKRGGYAALIEAWDARRFDAIVVDEVSRLARGGVELALLHEKVDRSRVRLLAANGLDSANPSWSLVFNVQSAVAQEERRETRHRVVRGMLGQLERGYAIGDAPFGYQGVVEVGPDGRPVGTRWVIDDATAPIVREMYVRRRAGQSYMQIARWLNQSGVAPPRAPRKDGATPQWRAGSVFRLLRNTIYVGIFVWQGSEFSRAKAKRENRDLQPRDFARPELRLVDDETYAVCTATEHRAHSGGRRHLFAGLLQCGNCNATLTVRRTTRGAETVYCASCTTARAAGVDCEVIGHLSSAAVRAALAAALDAVFGPTAERAFRTRLSEKLGADRSAEISRLEQSVSRAQAACTRLARLIGEVEDGSDELSHQFKVTLAERRALERQLEAARRGAPSDAERQAIELQLGAVPKAHFRSLLENPVDLQRARAVLGRLFPEVALMSKERRGTAVLAVCVAPGVGYAESTATSVVDGQRVRLLIRVECRRSGGVSWMAQLISPGEW